MDVVVNKKGVERVGGLLRERVEGHRRLIAGLHVRSLISVVFCVEVIVPALFDFLSVCF